MNQSLALEIMLGGNNVYLTGAAGAGKTYVLNQFIRHAKHEGKYVSVTATTGLAATHLGGTTIHSWSGMGVYSSIADGFVERLSKGRREIIEKTDVLIIDEISMLHDFRLDMVDTICRLVRRQPDVPFGGIQVIMSGDFFQLPPVNRGDERAGGFVVHSSAWSELELVICYIDEQHRQDDDRLRDILQALRSGDIRRHHAETLLSRVEASIGEGVTELHTTNVDVDRINEQRLDELVGDEIFYSQVTTGSQNYIESLQRSVLAPAVLRLKEHALVMAVKNDPNRRYANGSVGIVTAFEPGTEYPIVQFLNGKEVSMQPDMWELRDGEKKRASISQIPLRLAWAITVHKSQGMTLDAARIDLRKSFVEGMGYVALSRVRSLDTLELLGINRMALQVSAEALSIDDMLRGESKQAMKRFQHLAHLAEKRSIEPVKSTKKSSSSWSEKIEKMRETYPNAYRPWENAQDALLKQEFHNGKSIKELSSLLGRHENSIVLRLQKHFGEDIVQL